MTITDEKALQQAMPPAARPVEGPRSSTGSERRHLRKVAARVVGCGVLIATVGGYVAVHMSSEPAATDRAQRAATARLEGQADAYLAHQAATDRAQRAATARLEGQADAYFAHQAATDRAQRADGTP